MRRRPLIALALGLQLVSSGSEALALGEDPPVSLSWNSLASRFRERYQARSPERVDLAIAEIEAHLGGGFKIDPIVRASLERVGGERRLTTSVSQGSPYGTQLSVRRSSSESGASVGLTLSQRLLKGGPFAGFPEDDVDDLSYELALGKVARRADELLRDAFAALAAAEAAEESLSAARRSQANALDQNRAVQELVASGYKPKADLIVAEQAALRASQNVADAVAGAAEARRKLALALFDEPKTTSFAFPSSLELTAGRAILQQRLAPLAAVPWPDKTPKLREAELEAELARARGSIASRDDLPDLAVSFGIERGERDLGTTALPTGTSQNYEERTVALSFAMPLVSGLRRDQAELASMRATRAAASLAQTARDTASEKMSLEDKRTLAALALSAAERLAELATLSLGIEKQKYADGKATIADVRRVQEEESSAVRSLLAARRDALLAHLDWALAAGALGKLYR